MTLTRTIPLQRRYRTPPLEASDCTKVRRVVLDSTPISDCPARRRRDEAGESRLLHGTGLP